MSTSGFHAAAPTYLVVVCVAAITTTAMADKEGSGYRGKDCSESYITRWSIPKVNSCLWAPSYDLSDCYLWANEERAQC